MTHPSRGALAHLEAALADLERRGLRRRPGPPAEVRGGRSFASNDYLNLADRVAPPVATGSGASRLVNGEHPAHGELERGIASWLGVEACLLFTSGYAANVGTVAALAKPGDVIVSDALNHASLIDGCRLSRARVEVVPHGDIDAVARALTGRSESRAWVLVESYYSMDADGPDLSRLRAVCDAHGAALVVDEAHALGVLGPGGRGRSAEAGVLPDVLVGTLGKAFGSQGAFVAGSRLLREWLWNQARSFVFSTGLAPAAAEAARLALEEVRSADDARTRIQRLAVRLRQGLSELGLSVMGFGHVVPVVVGPSDRALGLAAAIREHGLHVPAIRPPTVPEGRARLRLTVTAAHEDADIDRVLVAFRRALETVG